MNNFNLSGRRITALVLRHYYLIRGSIPRILEMAYWPTVQMVIWGFVTQFFIGHSSWLASAAGVLIGAVLLGIYYLEVKLVFPCVFWKKCGLGI